MPEIGRRDFEQQFVGDLFAKVKEELLPEEIAKSDLARWVMSFDALLTDREDETAAKYNQSRDDAKQLQREVIEALSEGLVQARMPFFFASLFHIGRMWKVTESTLNECVAATNEGNLSASAQSLAYEAKKQNVFLDEQFAHQYLNELLTAGIQTHRSNLALARTWWDLWQSEVREYRLPFNQMREFAYDQRGGLWWKPMVTLLFLSEKPSALHSTMVDHGIKFKCGLSMPSQQPSVSNSLLMAAVLSWPIHDYERFRDWPHFLSDVLYHIRIAPAVQKAEQRLEEKYGNTNPFLVYKVGEKAPDQALNALIKEHFLPDNSYSWRMDDWQRTLEPQYLYTNLYFPKKGAKPYQEIVDWAFKSADSVVKSQLLRHEKAKAVESWRDFLQRLFEQAWLSYIGQMMSYANEGLEPSDQWTTADLTQLAADVVKKLNGIGYSLTEPTVLELKPTH